MTDWDIVVQIASLSRSINETGNKALITDFDNFLINGDRLSKQEVSSEVSKFIQLL